MSNENGEDTLMDDVQGSQNPGEATDEMELEGNQLFLV